MRMKKIVLLVATMVASFTLGVTVFAEVPEELHAENMQVKWSDEFYGTELNRNNWTPQIGDGFQYGGTNLIGWGNNEKENYMEKNVSVSGGTMKITAQYEPTTYMGRNYNWTSARIASNDLVHVGLGYVEAKIKIPSAQGIWPAFWMLGTNGKVWPKNGEIDIMEAFNTNKKLQSTIHYPTWTGTDKYLYMFTEQYDKTEWHTYGCYRDGEYIAFYIDRKLLARWTTADLTTGVNAGQRSVLNDDYYILLNVACGGNLAGGNPPATAGWNAVMEVDYVRYYTGDPTKAPETTTTANNNKTTVAKPKKVQITKAKNIAKRKISLKFKKVKGAKGYQVRWCDNKKFQGYWQKNTSKTSVVISRLRKKTKYSVKIRAYKVSGKKKIYGSWSGVKTIEIKK